MSVPCIQSLSDNLIEVWAGVECSINRVHDEYFDQTAYYGTAEFDESIHLFKELGITRVRFPLLWEKHQPLQNVPINWRSTKNNLDNLRAGNIDVIAGLVHHGSGPLYVNMLEHSFAEGLAEYALQVANEFPWIEYYTPVNEPLTTARFCGLYGLWHPHEQNDRSFCRILINECKGTVLAMQAIRRINPLAKLILTDDLGKIHSTPLLQYQADFENQRRWLSFDLLCGKVDSKHPLWHYLLASGITISELEFFLANKCEPHMLGLNHYLTSERFLDEKTDLYPPCTHGSNTQHKYADVEAVRVGNVCPDGPYKLLKQAWERYHLPIAVTEVHLSCTREEQMRWLDEIWQTANRLRREGVNIRAITPWAVIGSFGWNRLLTQQKGDYESGVFDISGGEFRRTILAEMISFYGAGIPFKHPVLNNQGWWKRNCRAIYRSDGPGNENDDVQHMLPVLIVDKAYAADNPIYKVCDLRAINYIRLTVDQTVNISLIEKAIVKFKCWAVVYLSDVSTVVKPKGNTYTGFNINFAGRLCIGQNANLPALSLSYVAGNNYRDDALLLKLINSGLDLLLDREHGIWEIDRSGTLIHVKNKANTSRSNETFPALDLDAV